MIFFLVFDLGRPVRWKPVTALTMSKMLGPSYEVEADDDDDDDDDLDIIYYASIEIGYDNNSF
jgi:hypothetical protein